MLASVDLGPRLWEELTSIPTVALVPMIRFGTSDADQSRAEVRSGQCYSVDDVMGIRTHGLSENDGFPEADCDKVTGSAGARPKGLEPLTDRVETGCSIH